jgi:hypothetical protein
MPDYSPDPELAPHHPYQNPAFQAVHRAAFALPAPEPAELAPGRVVWLMDYYYPGVVARVERAGDGPVVVIEIPEWDYAIDAPLMRDGVLSTTAIAYGPTQYRELRVDPAGAAFWPRPGSAPVA